MARRRPVESLTFAGMETAVEEQTAAAGVYTAGELTAKMLEPLGDVSRKAEELELNSPLFYGQVHPTLFQDLGWDHHDAQPVNLEPHHD
jgi:hypothetical protein